MIDREVDKAVIRHLEWLLSRERENNERLLLPRNKWEYRYGQCMGVIIVLTAAHLVVWAMLSP